MPGVNDSTSTPRTVAKKSCWINARSLSPPGETLLQCPTDLQWDQAPIAHSSNMLNNKPDTDILSLSHCPTNSKKLLQIFVLGVFRGSQPSFQREAYSTL